MRWSVRWRPSGGLVAALIAAGMPGPRIHERFLDFDYSRFRDSTPMSHVRMGGVGVALTEILEGGMYGGESLHDAAAEALSNAGVTTFADLRLDDPGIDPAVPDDARYRLVVVGSDITRQRMVRLPWDIRAEYGIDA